MEYTSAAFYLLWAAILVSVYVGREPALHPSLGQPAVAITRNASRTGERHHLLTCHLVLLDPSEVPQWIGASLYPEALKTIWLRLLDSAGDGR